VLRMAVLSRTAVVVSLLVILPGGGGITKNFQKLTEGGVNNLAESTER